MELENQKYLKKEEERSIYEIYIYIYLKVEE